MNAIYIYYGDNIHRTPEQREIIEKLRALFVLTSLKDYDLMEAVLRPPPFHGGIYAWEPSIPCELIVMAPVCPLPGVAHFINRCTHEYSRAEKLTVPVMLYSFGSMRFQGISFSNPELVCECACEGLTLPTLTRVATTIAEDIHIRVPNIVSA